MNLNSVSHFEISINFQCFNVFIFISHGHGKGRRQADELQARIKQQERNQRRRFLNSVNDERLIGEANQLKLSN